MAKEYRNSKRTDEWIKKAFVELLHEKKDINKITVNELVKRADITKTTFYYHYQDIYSVADEYENEILTLLDESIDELTNNNIQDIEKHWNKIINFIKEHENEYKMVINSSSTVDFINKLKTILSNKIFEKAKSSPTLPTDKNVSKVAANLLTNACVDTLVSYFKGMFNLSLDEVSNIIVAMFKKLIS